MIAGLALIATLVSAASATSFELIKEKRTHHEAVQLCLDRGMRLAEVNIENVRDLSAALKRDNMPAWVRSWNGDQYGTACLALDEGTVTARNCHDRVYFICQKGCKPVPPPVPESSSSSESCESSSSSSSHHPQSSSSSTCSESTETSCSDYSSSSCSFPSSSSCSNPCWSSESSSSCLSSIDLNCKRITYQVPVKQAKCLFKAIEKFPKAILASPQLCTSIDSIAGFFGVTAVIVDANGSNKCDPNDPINYGGYYEVIRSWALNIPIYVRRADTISIARTVILKNGITYNLHLSKVFPIPIYNQWCQWKTGAPEKQFEEIANQFADSLEESENGQAAKSEEAPESQQSESEPVQSEQRK